MRNRLMQTFKFLQIKYEIETEIKPRSFAREIVTLAGRVGSAHVFRVWVAGSCSGTQANISVLELW